MKKVDPQPETEPTTQVTPQSTTKRPFPCSTAMDQTQHMIVVLDVSSSIAAENFKLILETVCKMASTFTLRENNKFGFIVYSDIVNIVIPLNSTKYIDDIEADIRSTLLGTKGRRTDLAIDAAVSEFGPHDDADWAINIVILITTGKSDDPTRVLASAQQLKTNKIFALPLAINSTQSVSRLELTALTSKALNNENVVYVVHKFEDLDLVAFSVTVHACGVWIGNA